MVKAGHMSQRSLGACYVLEGQTFRSLDFPLSEDSCTAIGAAHRTVAIRMISSSPHGSWTLHVREFVEASLYATEELRLKFFRTGVRN